MWKELLSAGVVEETVPKLREPKPGEEKAKGGKGITRSAPTAEWKPVRVLTEYGKSLYDNTFGQEGMHVEAGQVVTNSLTAKGHGAALLARRARQLAEATDGGSDSQESRTVNLLAADRARLLARCAYLEEQLHVLTTATAHLAVEVTARTVLLHHVLKHLNLNEGKTIEEAYSALEAGQLTTRRNALRFEGQMFKERAAGVLSEKFPSRPLWEDDGVVSASSGLADGCELLVVSSAPKLCQELQNQHHKHDAISLSEMLLYLCVLPHGGISDGPFRLAESVIFDIESGATPPDITGENKRTGAWRTEQEAWAARELKFYWFREQRACFEENGYLDRVDKSKSLAPKARWVTGDPLKLDPFPTKDIFDEEDLPSLPRNPGAKLFILIISGTSTHETEAQANNGEAAYFCVNACSRAQQPEILSVWRRSAKLDALDAVGRDINVSLDRGCAEVPPKLRQEEDDAFAAMVSEYPVEYKLPYGELARRIVESRIRGAKDHPDCLGVVVLNFCHSHGVHLSMARMERQLREAGVAEKTFVMSTTGQWPGSITPRLMSVVLKVASNSDPTQKILRDRIRIACEMNYDSYKAAGMLHGRGDQEEPYVKQLKMSTI
jgi:transposase-like protein